MAQRAGFVNREIARAASLQATPNLPKAFEHYKSALIRYTFVLRTAVRASLGRPGAALMASARHWFQSSHEN